MRQGGFKPKNHNSGVYWVRANAGNNSSKSSTNGEQISGMWDVFGFMAGFIAFILLVVFYA